MPRKIATKHEETCSKKDNSRTRYACIEAHDATRTRIGTTQSRDHEDLLAEKGFNSLSRNHPVHKLIPRLQAVTTRVGKARKMPAWQATKAKSKKEVVEKAQERGKDSSFCDTGGLEPPQELGIGATVQKSE